MGERTYRRKAQKKCKRKKYARCSFCRGWARASMWVESIRFDAVTGRVIGEGYGAVIERLESATPGQRAMIDLAGAPVKQCKDCGRAVLLRVKAWDRL